MPCFALKKSLDNAEYYSKQNTKNDHGGDGKIKAEVFLFNPDVTGQMAYPMQFIVKEVNNQSDHNNGAANEHNIFTGIGIHINFILFLLQCFHRQ
jgi:hypothetical protein